MDLSFMPPMSVTSGVCTGSLRPSAEMRPKLMALPPLPTGGQRTAKPCQNWPPGGAARTSTAPLGPLLRLVIKKLRPRHESGGFVVCRLSGLVPWEGS
jgi:hypothetical protein